tara:strand:+ start:824 stop:1039 length:216 start_codon:yes stop_codon:yes gene_type:complete
MYLNIYELSRTSPDLEGDWHIETLVESTPVKNLSRAQKQVEFLNKRFISTQPFLGSTDMRAFLEPHPGTTK